MGIEDDARNSITPAEERAKPEVITAAPDLPAAPEAESPVLLHLLEIAEAHFAAGAVHQAMEIYFELVGEHHDTPEGAQAGDRLMNIARRYVSAGMLHQARSIYERLV